MRTVALVSMRGSIDWMCFPHFDSPSVFAALLDDAKRGGRFCIAPARGRRRTCKQLYWPDTNVLVTRFLSADGVGEIDDFMPLRRPRSARRSQIVRRVRVVRGAVDVPHRVRACLRLRARRPPKVTIVRHGAPSTAHGDARR